MSEKEIKKFELNVSLLNNFDKIMSIKLDEIEELKITSLDKGSKLINIISLCANVKTLIIDGDQRLNCDKILSNVFKPEKVENIILNNIKLPKKEIIKKFTNLKMISLNNIRLCNVNELFDGIVTPEKIEIINISNSDMLGNSIQVFKTFDHLKYISLLNITNLKLDNLEFFKTNKNLLKISITNNLIIINHVNDLLKCKCSKSISLDLVWNNGKRIENCKLNIDNDNSEITMLISDFENVSKDINLYQVKKLNIIINEKVSDLSKLKQIRRFKCDVNIKLKDFSCLDSEYAQKVKEILNVQRLEVESERGTSIYTVEQYVEMRDIIEEVLSNVSNHSENSEKFLEIYSFIGNEFDLVKKQENTNFAQKKCTAIELCELLKKCLKCIGIESNIIYGDDLENEIAHCWNQINLEQKWYNVDICMDLENIKKNKVEYCLLGDKDFLDSHLPRSGKNSYCGENFNKKLITVFFKTGLFKEKLFESYLEVTINKIKKIFNFAKKQEILALPSGDKENNEKN